MSRLFALVLLVALLPGGVSAQSHARATKPAQASAAPTAYTIENLTVEGNRNYSAAQILAVAGLKQGQKAGKSDFEAARNKLDATGAFDNVSYRYAPSKDGDGYDVVFEVGEVAQVYPVRFADLPASDAQLRAWLKQKDPLFGEKIPATKEVVARYVAWISEFLAKQNYHDAVAGKLSSDGGEDLALLFRPAKGYPAIAHVVFTDTGDIPAGQLQTAMYAVAIGVPYTEPRVRQLLDNTIRPIYEARGMLRVAFPKIETAPAKGVDGVTVTIQVTPGPPYKLEHVSFTGADYSRSEWRDLSKLKTDQTVNFDEVKAAQDRIRENQRRQGYLDATSQVARDVNDTDHTVGIEFQIGPGPLYKFRKVDIVGLDIETEPVIRKMWGMAPGRPFNVEYPDHFLARVKEGGVFDNLKSTRAETMIDRGSHTVDVTLYFNK
ncbi:MAG TPA: POTRA domain-containing protein [Bryobacteraceae bacterium]|nr:POTRA domain-containing protein [Bryobacteraceae bacterium]